MPLCGNFESEFWSIAKCYHQLCESVCTTNSPSFSLSMYTSPSHSLGYHVGVCNELLKFCLMQLAIACFITFLRGLLTQTVVLVWVFCMYFSSRPCNSLFDQLRLSDSIGSKSHLCNIDLGFPRIAPNVEAFTTPNISECYFWSFWGISCLANNPRLHFYWPLARRILLA